MYKILSRIYKSNSGDIVTLFVDYSENAIQQFEIKNDRLTIRGKESLVPGLLWKTLDSLVYLENNIKDFDFIIRSNISTVIEGKRLVELLKRSPDVHYLAGNLLKLEYYAPEYGIIDKTWWGTLYAQGTFIAMSSSLCQQIIKLRHKFHTNIVDDVAIGVFLRENFPEYKIYHLPRGRFISISDQKLTKDMALKIDNEYAPIVWRNKSTLRATDIDNMRTIECLPIFN